MQKQTILGITAHPADVFDGAAGTIANHVQNGDRVILLSLTHGAFSHGGVLTDKDEPDRNKLKKEIVELKIKEFKDGANALGVEETIVYDIDDEPLIRDREAILKLAEDIREYKPNIITTHHPNEFNHEDHSAAGEISIRAIKAAGRWIIDSKRPKHTVSSVYFYGFQFRPLVHKMGFVPQPPDIVVNIEKNIDLKFKALCAFPSQKYQETFIKRRIEMIEGNNGLLYGFKYAEWFISMYPTKTGLLPTSLSLNLDTLISKEYEK